MAFLGWGQTKAQIVSTQIDKKFLDSMLTLFRLFFDFVWISVKASKTLFDWIFYQIQKVIFGLTNVDKWTC